MSMLRRISNLFSRSRVEQEIDAELWSHLEMRAADNIASGMSLEAAHRDARLKFGNPAAMKERVTAVDTALGIESIFRDFGYALRQLRKSPGFAITAVLTLALGIGATAAMFSVLDAVLLHPLPYRGVDRIVDVETHSPGGRTGPISWPEYQDLRRLNMSFSAFAGVATSSGVTLTQGNQAIYLPATKTTDNFFNVFAVAPLLGRTFLPGEDQNGKNNVVVLSYEVWLQDFGGKRSTVGKTVYLNGSPYTIVGVMPAGFRYPIGVPNLVYTPLHLTADQIKFRSMHWLYTINRLRPGVSAVRATADLDHVLDELGKQFPDWDKGWFARVTPFLDTLHTRQNGKNDRPELWVLLGAVFAVLLIACTNVAGLLLARGLVREREMAVRAALGAGRKQLVGQMLTESIVLGLAGGAGGIGLAMLLLAGMQQFLEKAFARGGNVHLNVSVLAATFVISLLASVATGLVPAWRAGHADPNEGIKTGGNAGTTRNQHRLRAGFVVAQMALSLMLLVCSGLLLLDLRGMFQTDLGFNPKNLLTLEVDIPTGDYQGRDFVRALVEPLEARVRAIPGVTAVGSNNLLPILQHNLSSTLGVVGQPPDAPGHERFSRLRFITPGYFRAMQLPILRGRDFTGQDAAKTQPVAIVNKAWVEEFLPKNGDALVHAFDNGSGSPSTAIVGVARSGRQDLFEPAMPEIDFPFSQMPIHFESYIPSFYLFVRTSVPTTSIIPQLRKALSHVAPNIAFRTPETMEAVLDDALVTNRMLSWLFALFAAIAVLLTAIGIYGLLSQEVVSHTRDIGVRMALGATRARVAKMVLERVGLLLAIGLTIGLGGVLVAHRLLNNVLAIRLERDGWAIVILVPVLGAIGLLSALIPACRAASIDPMQALRTD